MIYIDVGCTGSNAGVEMVFLHPFIVTSCTSIGAHECNDTNDEFDCDPGLHWSHTSIIVAPYGSDSVMPPLPACLNADILCQIYSKPPGQTHYMSSICSK